MARHKMTKACDVTSRVKAKVFARDRQCIICGSRHNLQAAHYIGRAQGGLGIEENLVMLCSQCHFEYDNGKHRKDYGNFIAKYLGDKYQDWNKKTLIYSKWRNYE